MTQTPSLGTHFFAFPQNLTFACCLKPKPQHTRLSFKREAELSDSLKFFSTLPLLYVEPKSYQLPMDYLSTSGKFFSTFLPK
jgi:hypothetical protein